jgi:ABC-2 type transport system ATP-binding protein
MIDGAPMVQITNLTFAYGRETLFQGMELVLEPGNIYGLLGVNGAGKTTLLKLVTGLLFPGSGTVTALGHSPGRREPSFLSQVFMLPEELDIPTVTDREYVRMRAPFYPAFDAARLERYIGEFDLPRNRKLSGFSYGQKKKFFLSFGLACRPSLLLLDEPTNGLDIPSKGLFRRLVAESLTREQIVVISTHQVRDVESLIDPIVILHEGRVLVSCSLAQVTSRVRISHTTTPPDSTAEGFLYSEPAVGGFSTVWKARDSAASHVDLEVLFKTVISQPETCRSLFGAEEGSP